TCSQNLHVQKTTERHVCRLFLTFYVLELRTNRGFFYHPRSRTWSDAPPSPTPRLYATAALLPDGSLMVLDGFNRSGVLDSADVLGPDHRWKTFASRDMVKRKETGAALLPDGSLMLVGGEDPSGNSIGVATRLH
ncbi:MAG: hypothetical protein ACYCR5_07790, partial [Leptospirillum sp.]